MAPSNRVKKIIHVDMDAFYASVEQRDRPELKGRPVVVGGRPESRGVVCAASYEARKFGIRSAMGSHQAFRLCPHAVFLKPDFQKYKAASRLIREIFYSVTDLVEPLSLDEAYLDVTENKLGEPLASRIAVHLRQRIRTELSLTASAGVAPNKFLAKLASDLRKPDGLVVIPPEKVQEFLRALPIEKLWGVGPATAKKLHARGLFTTEDLRRQSASSLETSFGRFGRFLHGLAFGEDPREVNGHRDPKSSGSETTFPRDTRDRRFLEDTLRELASEVAESLAAMPRRARTVTLKLRYQDFRRVTRSRTLENPTDQSRELGDAAVALLARAWTERDAIRLIGISASNLVDPAAPEQLWLDAIG